MNTYKLSGLLAILFQFTILFSQKPEFIKVKIGNLQEVSINNNNDRSILNQHYLRDDLKTSKGSSARLIKPEKDMHLLHSTNRFNYYSAYDNKKAEQSIGKYDHNNQKKAEIELPIEGEVIFKQTGEMIFLETGDGEGFAFIFYNEDFTEKESYIPYQNGFSEYRYCIRDERVVIITKKDFNSQTLKLAVFSQLELENETEITMDFTPQILNIKISGEKIIFLCYDSDSNKQKIVCFDQELHYNWEKELENPIVGNKILVDQNNLILITPNDICKINPQNGAESWRKDLKLSEKSCLESKLVYAGKHLVYLHGEQQDDGKIKNNMLYVLDINSGDRVFSDKLEDCANQNKVFSDDSSFTIINNGNLMKYLIVNNKK